MTPRPGPLRSLGDLARVEVVNVLRSGLLKPAFFVQPLLFLGIILFGLVAPKLEESKASERETRVAVLVAPDAGAAPRALVEALRAAPPPKLVLQDDPDPLAAVGAERTEAGLIVRADRVEAVNLPSVAASRLGLTRLRDALARAETDRAVAAGTAVSAVAVERSDLLRTERGKRFALADIAPLYLLLQLSQVAFSASAAVRGDKDSRSIEPLLTLPLPRWVLVAGKAAAPLLEGLLRLAVLIAVLVLSTHLPGISVGFSVGLGALAAMAAGGVALTFGFVGLGILIGAGARSSGQESAGSAAISMGAVVVGLVMTQLKVAGGPLPVRLLPIIGPALSFRGALFEVVGPGALALSILVGALTGLAALAGAAVLLGRDGLTLRDA